jgi:serine/threonine-protein kinase
MNRDRWQRVKALFQEALQLPDDERREFLEQLGVDDSETLLEVESLLTSHNTSESFLEQPPSGIAAEFLGETTSLDGALGEIDLPAMEGRRLGPYRIQRRIGHGGLGSVYLATREEEFKKEVAIKLIRRSVATPELLRRFEFERQILASIEHPNIARLLDGGTTEEGLPYLVMEYIDGEPVDRFCDRKQLSTRQRLELFATVCEAVETAHRSLVVHCDIKPDNVFITTDGTPKLLDFGIARILASDTAAESVAGGESSTRILTPDYASPEQLRGDRITTASDVYSLGVLLYELLTGARPHSVAEGSLDEAAHVVSGAEPKRPSAAANVSNRELAEDVDCIVMKALETDPLRRYMTVEAFAVDIRSFLGGFPVIARQGGFTYRASRFIGRHRLAALATAIAISTLLVFLVTITVQSARLASARDRAEKEAASARVVSEFLQEMLTTADPFEGIGGNATVLEALDLAVSEIESAFVGQPVLEAAVRDAAGTTYLQLGRYDEAEPQLLKGLEIRRDLGPEHRRDLARSLNSVGHLTQERGNYEAAEALFREALEIAESIPLPDPALTADSIAYLATVRHDRGDLAGAEDLYRRALSLRRELASDDADIAVSLDDLGALLQETGSLDVAEEMFREALSIRQRLLDPGHPDISSSLNNLASALHDQGELDEAEELYRRSLQMAKERFADEHPQVAIAMNNLATLLHDQEGTLVEAEALYRESLAMTRRLQGEEHPEVATSLGNLAALLHDKGDLPEAEDLYRQALAMARRFLGDTHPTVARVLDDLAVLLQDRGDLAGAESAFQEALSINRQSPDQNQETVAFILADLATVICAHGEPERALPHFQEAVALLESGDSNEVILADIHTDLETCRASASN